ncbi:WD40-repeat-containing domain protein [Pseudomassariella vexata]|uniref:Pre-rRNA-processing protein IPI3 n=1 Tax=Pseudomassariella vexata TaxID=1141098 RepID=A0A1Y2E8R3_9PEZI|nr:WD40-repeat-containing domain protein [Pseudomassariella vexata]ORY67676.1 WD40-repeat-containing domain protein [Pseudomassariella vexata]
MLSENYFASVSGPPISNNTAIAKDVGIYGHTLHPSHSTTNTFKKSSVPRHCLAVSDTHVFAAQHEKSTVHVYSRIRGNQELTVTFQERIKSVVLQDDVLILGTAEGRIVLWEICTGRQVSTPASHVQAVTCLASTPYHIITGSDDSNVLVWQIAQLLELDTTIEQEPCQTLSNHRAAITSLVVNQSTNPDTNICVSASKDKSCIIWNYQTGIALRTLLFPSFPLCLSLEPCARALYISSDDGSMFAVDLFAENALLGPQSTEASSTVVQISVAAGEAPQEAGCASCLGLSYDGTILLSGHAQGQILRWDLGNQTKPTELANLNAPVTNLIFISPLSSDRPTKCATIIKPFLGSRSYNFTTQLESDLVEETRFGKMLASNGFSSDALEQAIQALQEPRVDSIGDDELRKENEGLWDIINEQRALQKKTLQRYVDVKSAD